MIFNSMWPLAFLIVIPIIIILYLLKPKGRDKKISSNLLWMKLFKNTQSKTFFEKFVHNILMYLQILISLLLILALMSPHISTKGASKGNVIMLIDSSASMQHDTEGGKTRFEEAVKTANDYVEGSKGTKFTIISCDFSAKLLLTNSENTKKVKETLTNLEVTDKSGDLSNAASVIETLSKNAKSGEKTKVVIFTDGSGLSQAELYKDQYDVEISVSGEAASNVCIDYIVTTKTDEGYDAAVKISNYSDSDVSMEVTLYDGEDSIIEVRQISILKSETTVSIFKNVSWKNDYLKADLSGISFSGQEKDSLAKDNKAYAVKDNTSLQDAVLIGEGNIYLEKAYTAVADKGIIKAENDLIFSDGKYKVGVYDSGTDITSDVNRLVFDGTNNKSETKKNVLIEVPEGELTTGLKDFSIGVNSVTCYELPKWAKSFMECDGQTVGYYGEHDGIKEVVVGFNLRESDFPLKAEFPVFFANALSYLSDTTLLAQNTYMAGEMISFNPSSNYDVNEIEASTDKAGIYSVTANVTENVAANDVTANDMSEYYVVRFSTDTESDGRFTDSGISASEEYTSIKVKKNIRSLLLIIALIFMIIEWFIYIKQMRYKGKFYLIIRIIGSIFVICAAIGMRIPSKTKDATTVFVVDMSESNSGNEEEMTNYLRDTLSKMPKNNHYGIVTFGEDSLVEQFITDEDSFTGLLTKPDVNATNIESAISSALSLMPQDEAGRIVIMTDGRETSGDVFDTALSLVSNEVELESIIFENDSKEDAYVADVTMPGTIHPGDEYNLKVTIVSNYDTDAVVKLLSGSNKLFSSDVHLNKGTNEFVFKQVASDSDIESFKVTVTAKGDTTAKNDFYNVYSKVEAAPKILVISGMNENSDSFKAVLSATGMDYNVVSAINAPSTLNDMLFYKSIILENVYISDLPQGFLDNLDAYVKDYGCGFICTGGEDSFALGGYRDTVIEDVLPVDMELMGANEIPSMAMVMVIDHSGSMTDVVDSGSGETNLDIAIKAATGAVTNLRDTDYVGVLTFDDTYKWQVEITKADSKDDINKSIETINYGGGTTIKPALTEAYNQISKTDAKIKHIVLLTDGMGETTNFDDICEELNAAGITLSTVAVGQDSDRKLLEGIADKCGGRYYYSDISTDVPKIFAQEVFLSGDTYIQNGNFKLNVVQSDQLVRDLFTDGWPEIYGYICATPKTASNVIISSAEKNSPILSTWQYGLGKTVAWNTDVSNEWTGSYAGNDDYAGMWKRIIDYVSGGASPGEDTVEVVKEAGKSLIVYNTENYDDSTDLSGVYTAPDGTAGELKFSCIKPGKYEALLDDTDTGIYNINVRKSEKGAITNSITTAASIQYSDEYKFDIDNKSYKSFITKYGKIITEDDKVWNKLKTSTRKNYDLTEILIILSILVFLYDVFVRRFCYVPKKKRAKGMGKQEDKYDENHSIKINHVEEHTEILTANDASMMPFYQQKKIMSDDKKKNDKKDKKARRGKKENKPSSTLDTSALLKKKEDRNI